MILIESCNKSDSTNDAPVSLTDKNGNIFIPIDTATLSFTAYSPLTKINTGHLKGIFNDTVKSAFYLDVLSGPYWDTIFHRVDTVLLSAQIKIPIRAFEADVDLKDSKSPYHFLLTGISKTQLKSDLHTKPNVVITIDVNKN
jgi:hypothetical protein